MLSQLPNLTRNKPHLLYFQLSSGSKLFRSAMEAAFQSGFASALLDVLFNKVTELVIVEGKKFLRCDDAMKKLETTIVLGQNLLKKLDAAEMKGNTKIVVQKRVHDLNRLFYDAEDLMGDIVALTKLSSSSYENPVLNAILKKGKWTKPREITKLQEKMEAILEQLESLEKYICEPESERVESNNQNKLNSIAPLFGREGDVKEITNNLLSHTSQFDGVSIVAIGGLGKTRLAQTIESEATAHFSAILWVDVPRGDFKRDEVIQKMNELQASYPCADSNANVPSQGDSSVLIIFDNLRKVGLTDWCEMLTDIKNNGINGKKYQNIKFLITTFSPKVATRTRTRSHYLEPLCDEDCKKVIINMTQSMGRDLSGSPDLDEVTLTLAKNSGGLPSVARRLGHFLGQYGVEYVKAILNEDMWDSDDFQKQILPALKPCYLEFKSHLKRYLAYFTLFPQDCHYVFTIDELIHLWVGEGFIQHPKGISKMIEIGKKHFEQLLGMSIIRLLHENTTGKPTFELNEFSRKFSQLVASETCMQLSPGVSASYINTRHLSLSYNNDAPPIWDEVKKFKALRTFFALLRSNVGVIPPSTFKKLTRLQVLSLSGSDVFKLPDSINCLKRLRYLNVSHTRIKSLPQTLHELSALQFLKFTKRVPEKEGFLEYLPEKFYELTNIIYLDWNIDDIRHMGLPAHIGKLSSLQTLPLFPVGNKDGYHISELNNMNDLQGSIVISNLQCVQDNWVVPRNVALEKKSFRRIELEWGRSTNCDNSYQVLGGLQPNKCLKELKITNYSANKFPDWLTQSLPELEKMHLHNCPLVEILPELGLLRSLKFLILEDIENVVNIDPTFFREGYFPNLESLKIMHMEQLKAWNSGLVSNVMPHLKALKFSSCPKLNSVSSLQHLTSLDKLEIERCGDWSSLPKLTISLDSLTITESDLLRDCCKQGCEDWPKVDRIAKVQIHYEKISTSASNSIPTAIDYQ